MAGLVLAIAGLAAALAVLLWAHPRPHPTSPLAMAAVTGSPRELRRELAVHPDLGKADRWPPLVWAARAGRADSIRDLVQAGADPDLRDAGPNGWTPLLHAVHKDQPAAVRALLAAGADVDRPGANGLTPLMLACAQGEAEIVGTLLDAGAETRARGPMGWSALEQAVESGDARSVELLLRRDPGLRIGGGPRGMAVRALAWVTGKSRLVARVDRAARAARVAEAGR